MPTEKSRIVGLEDQEVVVFKVEIVETVFSQPMGQLCQEGGFAYPSQAGDDDGMRDGRRLLDLSQAITLEAGFSLPKGLLLLNQQRCELIRGPFGPPWVFIHSEMIGRNVFAANEIFSSRSGTLPPT